MERRIQFSDRQAEAMAIFIATLEKAGIAYKIRNMCGGWEVTITGY